MAEFTVNAHRFDPYKNFKFRLKWDGQYVAGVSKVSGLKRTTEVVKHREGGDPSTSRKSPGRPTSRPSRWSAGSHTIWLSRRGPPRSGNSMPAWDRVSLDDFRKDVILDFYNEAGQLAISYKIYRAWVSEYQALPDLDANANAVAIQHIKLENEGWERDTRSSSRRNKLHIGRGVGASGGRWPDSASRFFFCLSNGERRTMRGLAGEQLLRAWELSRELPEQQAALPL